MQKEKIKKKTKRKAKNKVWRILKKEIVMFFSGESLYKKQILAWLIADIIKVVGLCFVWMSASKYTSDITRNYVVTYYILLMLISKLTTDRTIEFGIGNILSGRFSNLLIKPFNYLTEYLGINIGNNFFRTILFLPAFLVALFLVKRANLWMFNIAGFSIVEILLIALSIVIGFLINFFIGNTVALIAIFVKEVDGIRVFYYNIFSMLSGEFIPFAFLPTIGQQVMTFLPFRYTLSFPIELIINSLSIQEMQFGFVLSLLWLAVCIVIYKIFYKISLTHYEAEGL